MNPLSIIAGPLISGIKNLSKTFFGDAEARDAQRQEQFTSVQNSYQSEFLAPEKSNWFNILVDGYNRLQRPAMTSGVIALFVWAAIDPASFAITMNALSAVPEMLWYILASIVAFWFSGRILEKAPMRIKSAEVKQMQETAKVVNEQRKALNSEKDWEDKYQQELKDTSKPLSNRAILEWNERNSRK
jgi:hypothetical protein